jgi:hypothetical protein
MIQLNHIKYHNKYPYTVFEFPEFIDENIFNILKNTFPNPSLETFKNDSDGKFSFYSDSEHFANLRKNIKVNDFFNYLESKNFINNLIKILYKDILISSFNFKVLYKVLTAIILKKNVFRIQIQYSYIINGGFIVPHVDGRKKLISLMLYFPEEMENKIVSEKEKNSGTYFLINNYKQIKGGHIKCKETADKLKKNSKIFFIPFIKKNLYGFIKSNNSWHGLEPVDVHENYIRKSININILI